MKEKYESPHKQSWMRVSSIFLDRVGGRQNCKKISKRMHFFVKEPRNDRKI